MTEITQLSKYLNARNGVVSLANYISSAQATENNASRIADAIAATPVGGYLIGPDYDIYTGPITIDKRINVILPGKLVRHSSQTNFSGLATISAADATFQCRDVDMNAYGVTTWSGAAHIVVLAGERVIVRHTRASNSPYIAANASLSRGFCIEAPGCLIEDSSTYRTGDGFRFNEIATLDADNRPIGDGTVRRCRAYEYFNKGFTLYANCGTVTYDDVDGTMSPTYGVAGSCLVQSDPGDGYRAYKFVVKNSLLQSDAPGSIKVTGTRYFVLENTKVLHNYNGPRAVDCQDQYLGDPVAYQYCEAFLTNVEIENDLITNNYVFRADKMWNVRCKNVNFIRPATAGTVGACWVQKTAIFEDCGWDSGGYTNARAIDDGGATDPGSKRIAVIRPRNLQATQHDLFRRYTTTMPVGGEYLAADLIGNWRLSNDNGWDMLVQRNVGSPATTYTTTSGTPAAPTTGTFEQGYTVLSHKPSAGGVPGWVCTTTGTLTTISTTGDITTGTATLTVASATNIYVGSYITIAGVTGVKKVTARSGTTITIDSNADATVSGAAVANSAAVFRAMAALA